MPMMYYYGWSWGGALFMALGSLFWLGVLGLLLWAAIRWASRSSNAPSDPPAREIVARRYARGEIDTSTYEHILVHIQDREAEPTMR